LIKIVLHWLLGGAEAAYDGATRNSVGKQVENDGRQKGQRLISQWPARRNLHLQTLYNCFIFNQSMFWMRSVCSSTCLPAISVTVHNKAEAQFLHKGHDYVIKLMFPTKVFLEILLRIRVYVASGTDIQIYIGITVVNDPVAASGASPNHTFCPLLSDTSVECMTCGPAFSPFLGMDAHMTPRQLTVRMIMPKSASVLLI
jgi:hypothetical protein